MRTLVVVLAVLCLTPLWAEEPLAAPFTVGFDWEDSILRGFFTNDFFLFELEYNLQNRFTDKVVFSWLAYGQNPKDPWNLYLMVEPAMWESEISRELGHEPIRPDRFYAGVHWLKDWADVRVAAFAASSDGSKAYPFIELRQLRLARLNHRFDFIAKGFLSQEQSRWAAGFDYTLNRNLDAKLLYGSDNLEWSVSFRTVLNR